MTIHIVQEGDSLWKLSRQYEVTIDEISAANGLTSSLLMPGLALYVPDRVLTNRLYRIQEGDQFWLLARQFRTTVTAIRAANPALDPYRLPVGETMIIPSPLLPEMVTVGFIVPYSIEQFLASLEGFAEQLTYVAVASYSVTEEGEAYVVLDDGDIPERSRQLQVTPLLMIRNILPDGTFSPELVGAVLESTDARRRLIDSLLAFINEKNYGGVSIDFEFIPPARRSDFVLFLRELKQALGALPLHVSVHAKTADIPDNPIIGAYDYREISQEADIVAVMTMDYGYPGGPPNPVAPIWWVDEVIRYALTEIPAGKLQISFPLYGYDWLDQTNESSGLSALGAQNLALDRGAVIEFDMTALSPHFAYWQEEGRHLVWFEDIRSYVSKYQLVDLYGLLGVTFWEVRLPFPQNWAYMKQHIMVLK
ncbi:glycosyl hydrolase family 18 protein [Alkalihalobacillus oceani]|uniref:glycosyl hydrolase family 18 protein n=1 Tax=Halalkalibacter oceani TaxID=1653776 RepID=UPI00203EA8F4|nr:glycosyl hydrolase family 18 protein [Halalkalibacter oceani]